LAAIVGQERALDGFELLRGDEYRTGALARDALRSRAQKPGSEFLVNASVTDNNQVGHFGALANLVGNDP
jgi:hypothetical protein